MVKMRSSSTPSSTDIRIDQRMVVARYGDDWKVVGDATLVGGRAPATMLWEFAGLRVADVHTAGGTSVIASYPGTADLVDRARGLLPDAVQAVESFWGSQWPRRVAVVTTGTAGQFTGLSGAPEADGAAAAALAASAFGCTVSEPAAAGDGAAATAPSSITAMT